MSLTCKNCGGNVSLDIDSNTIVCDSCGVQQSLSNVLADETQNYIFREDELPKNSLSTYKRAISIMSTAKTENSFILAASVFEKIPDVLNSEFLAMECRGKAELFKTERIYNTAIQEMQSDNPARVENAIKTFKSLGDYKDSVSKIGECIPLLKTAQETYQEKLKIAEQQRLVAERQKQKQAAKKRFVGKLVTFIIFVLAALAIICHFHMYSSSNIKINLSPDNENFITEKYNKYVFNYDVKIENTGLLDVSSVEGTVIFEKDDEILIDTRIGFNNYSSAIVRAKKSSKFSWELTVYSYDTALVLYETDFDDLDVKIDITSITYTNGKTKTY